ncbi:MAG TPA: hypothetical protein PLB51_00490 [Candidatus Paceibacterota bacterium]|nr:hypothetical protein [Candidatus Paceibacterota bacterium]
MKGGYRKGAGRKKGFAAYEAEKAREFIVQRLSADLEPIIEKAIKQARRGDKQARTWLFERAYGKPKETVDMSINNPVPLLTDPQKEKIARRVLMKTKNIN